MKRAISVVAALALVAAPALAQVDPGFAWLIPTGINPDIIALPKGALDQGVVFTEDAGASGQNGVVRIEHWVTTQTPSDGLKLGGMTLLGGGPTHYQSAEQFLAEMAGIGSGENLTLFYAKQVLLYRPLPVAARQPWPSSTRGPVSCAQLQSNGRQTGVHLRLRDATTFEDHWVFYPDYTAPNQQGGAPLDIVADAACPPLGTWLSSELSKAEQTPNAQRYVHAFSIYQLEPLTLPGDSN